MMNSPAVTKVRQSPKAQHRAAAGLAETTRIWRRSHELCPKLAGPSFFRSHGEMGRRPRAHHAAGNAGCGGGVSWGEVPPNRTRRKTLRAWLAPMLAVLGVAVLLGCGVGPAGPEPPGGAEGGAGTTGAGGRVPAASPLRAKETPTDGFRHVEGFGEGFLWVSDYGDYRCGGDCGAPQETFLRRFDPETREAYPATLVEGGDVEIAFGAGSVWATSERGVLRIDPETGRVTRTIPLKYAGGAASGVAFGEGAVWAAGAGDGAVSRIDPEENGVVARIDVGEGGRGAAPNAVAVGAGSVWVGTRDEGLARIDPAKNRVVDATPIEKNVPDGRSSDVSDVAVGAGAVWVAGSYGDWTGYEGKLTKVDPKTAEVVGEVALDQGAWEVETTREAVWATSSVDPGAYGGSMTAALSRLDPDQNRVVGSLRADSLSGPAAGGGSVWAMEAEQDGPSSLLELAP